MHRPPRQPRRTVGRFVAELQKTVHTLKTSERRAYVTISRSSAMVCQAEFPPVPIEEIKSALKLNSAGYLRRDFSSYYLDAFELKKGSQYPKARAKGAAKPAQASKTKDAAKTKDKEDKPNDKGKDGAKTINPRRRREQRKKWTRAGGRSLRPRSNPR